MLEDNLEPLCLIFACLQRSAKMPKKTSEAGKVTKEPTFKILELDGPTQEFSLGTPRIRMDYQEPSTPEMPDLSSVTQDICKVSLCLFPLMAHLTTETTIPAVLFELTNYRHCELLTVF